MSVTDRELIEAWLRTNGQSAESWGTQDDEGWAQLAGKWRVVEDVHVEEGPFEDEEGVVRISVVGSEQYHNRRVAIGFMAEGTDTPLDVDFSFLEPAS